MRILFTVLLAGAIFTAMSSCTKKEDDASAPGGITDAGPVEGTSSTNEAKETEEKDKKDDAEGGAEEETKK